MVNVPVPENPGREDPGLDRFSGSESLGTEDSEMQPGRAVHLKVGAAVLEDLDQELGPPHGHPRMDLYPEGQILRPTQLW